MSDNTTAAELFNQRAKSWGEATHTHARIALVWEGIGDLQPETAGLAALKMAGMKLVRAAINPDDPDSFDDAEVYIDIARQCFVLPSKLAHESQPDPWLVNAQCFHVSCTREQNHRHGSQCTSSCKCGMGTT